MDRGGVQLISTDFDALQNIRKDWLKSGFINLTARIGPAYPDPRVERLPSISELGISPVANKIAAAVEGPAVAGRPFAAPPGVPQDRVDMPRQAFKRTMQDPEYLARA